MTDLPTPPEPDRPDRSDRPDQGQPVSDETAALPQSDPTATGPLPPHPPGAVPPTPGYGALPPQPGPGWPAAGVPTASAAAGVRPGGPRRWWDDATSTGAGRAALIAVAVLGSLLLVAGVGLAAALVAGHDRWDRGEMGWTSEDRGPGHGKGDVRGDRGNGKDKDKGNRGNGNGMMGGDRDGAQGPGGGRANPVNPANPDLPGGNGMGMGMGAGRGAGALGDVLHGEYTTNVTGTPTVMVVQAGQVTAYTAGTSLTVKSSDGFEAKYALDGGVETTRGTTALATGVQVRVVAAKEGMKVTRLVVG